MAKYLVFVIILVVIAGGAYYFGVQKNKAAPIVSPSALNSLTSPTPQASNSSEATSKTPDQAAKAFYDFYQDCMKNPPKAALGQVGNWCQENNPNITSTFVANLEKGDVAKEGADPIVCAQQPPESITAEAFIISGNSAQGKVSEKFGPMTVEPVLSLLKETSGWKVDNITCPKPQ